MAELWDGLTDAIRRIKALESASIDEARVTELTKNVAALSAWRAEMERESARALSKYRATARLIDPALADVMRDAGLD